MKGLERENEGRERESRLKKKKRGRGKGSTVKDLDCESKQSTADRGIHHGPIMVAAGTKIFLIFAIPRP